MYHVPRTVPCAISHAPKCSAALLDTSLAAPEQGNRLAAEGTKALAPGLARNRSLVHLSLADNAIGSGDADVSALEDFRDAMLSCPTLTHIDLLYNRIGERGAQVGGGKAHLLLSTSNTNLAHR